MYIKMINLKYTIQARVNSTQENHTIVEKIQALINNYTIDYEEYFNRYNVWCDIVSGAFSRDIGENGYCDIFTAYGNQNNIQANTSQHELYYCSSKIKSIGEWYNIFPWENGSWCVHTGRQSFGQYYRQFWDTHNNVHNKKLWYTDEDDENLMTGPEAIHDHTNIAELYLISQQGDARIFFRRKLIASGDWNHDGTTGNISSEMKYTLQILQLRGFDAGENHDFDINNHSGVYDGNIDTRACDYAKWFICHGSGIGQIYSGYALPIDQNDGRVDFTHNSTTLKVRNILISPSKNPLYASAESYVQINPYITIKYTNGIYGKLRQKRMGTQDLSTYETSSQTTFNIKNRYTQ